jgi:hypothetical protein
MDVAIAIGVLIAFCGFVWHIVGQNSPDWPDHARQRADRPQWNLNPKFTGWFCAVLFCLIYFLTGLFVPAALVALLGYGGLKIIEAVFR